jgi:DNA invertase Pin-like site-specific DNA recombinase
MLVGYARDNGAGQSLALELRALSDAGCAKLFSDQRCGGSRAALQRALDFACIGDTLVVAGLDRLGPSPNDIQEILGHLADSGVSLSCLHDTPAMGAQIASASSGHPGDR